MGTHAQLGVRFPDGTISGCYVHYDGHTLKQRISDYIDKNTTTSLVLLIVQAQAVGGIRSFHSAPVSSLTTDDFTPETEFLSDGSPWPIDEHSWGNASLAESYFWLVDYKTGRIENIQNGEYHGSD